MTHLPALVTLLTVLLLLGITIVVGRARGRYGIKAPAISGHPMFERIYRVQMNTLENTLMFLPALWLAARFDNPFLAGIFGLVWVAARVWYGVAYVRRPDSRGSAFGLAALALIAVIVMAAIGTVRAMLVHA